MNEQELIVDTQDHPMLVQQRRRAWEAFLLLAKSTSLPTDTFKKAPTGILPTQKEIRDLVPEESQNSFIIFFNGWFCQELSDISGMKKCLLLPLKEAVKTFSGLVQGIFSKTLSTEESHMALLNYAMHQAGAFVYIPPKSLLQTPLFILSIIHAESSQWIMPKVQLFIGASSEIKVHRTTKCLSASNCLYNTHIELAVEEQATVEVINDDFEAKNSTHWHFDTTRASVKSQATFSTLQLASHLSASYDVKVALIGEASQANVSGLSLLANETHISSQILVDHHAPSCRSMQLFKNVLTGTSKATFTGKILVRQKAQKTESYQLNRSLLQSDFATSKSSPNLEIFADDVKASHGSTCGQLDEEELFYLTSRGIKIKDAQRILLAGFCEEITKKSFSPQQRTQFSNLLATYDV